MTQKEKISNRRKECGLSQEALAQQLGVSRQAVSKWETGESAPDSINLIALAQVFGVTVDWLLDPTASAIGAEHIQKPKRKINWGYPLYLLGMALFFFVIITTDIRVGTMISFHKLVMFWDMPLFVFMLIGGVLLLAVTGQIKDFGRAFSCSFLQNVRPEPKGKKSIDTVLLGMVLSGTAYLICFTISIMNDIFFAKYPIGVIVDMWLIFVFYLIAALFVLLPIRFRQEEKEKNGK